MQMRIGFISLLLLISCSTYTKRTCEQRAWEAAGNALDSTTQMAHDEAFERRDRNSTATGMDSPHDGQVLSGEWSGPHSETPYRGPSSREAYDKVMASCGK
jgi:hypothetical protein